MYTGFDTIIPLALGYFAYKKFPVLKTLRPFKKLNPSINKVIAIAVSAPTFVSLEIFINANLRVIM
jgi:hypothetical protein